MVGERLRELRKAKGMTQKEIAKEFDISVQNYSRYELNQREPTMMQIREFAMFFKVSSDYLIGLTDENTYVDEATKKFRKNMIEGTKISDDDLQIIKAYQRLDPYGKRVVRRVLDEEYNRSIIVNLRDNAEIIDGLSEDEITTKDKKEAIRTSIQNEISRFEKLGRNGVISYADVEFYLMCLNRLMDRWVN